MQVYPTRVGPELHRKAHAVARALVLLALLSTACEFPGRQAYTAGPEPVNVPTPRAAPFASADNRSEVSYSTGGSLPISGRITSPRNGEFVDRTFRVSAETDDLSSPWSAWLAVEIGDLLWAKGPPLRTGERHWTRVMTEGGAPAGAELWIWLLAVRPEGDQFFENWMATGRATGQYPGLQFDEIPTATRLDRVRVTVRTR